MMSHPKQVRAGIEVQNKKRKGTSSSYTSSDYEELYYRRANNSYDDSDLINNSYDDESPENDGENERDGETDELEENKKYEYIDNDPIAKDLLNDNASNGEADEKNSVLTAESDGSFTFEQ